jgi:citrate lyase subunit beta/citryl-CoA lyase
LVFSPTSAEVDQAKRILSALKEAAESGKGAASLDGRMIDAVSSRMAENLVKRNEEVQSKFSTR